MADRQQVRNLGPYPGIIEAGYAITAIKAVRPDLQATAVQRGSLFFVRVRSPKKKKTPQPRQPWDVDQLRELLNQFSGDARILPDFFEPPEDGAPFVRLVGFQEMKDSKDKPYLSVQVELGYPE